MALGLTGSPIHTGSWGLPDIGFTEWLQGTAAPMNYQGGSTLNKPTTQEYLPQGGQGYQTAEQIKASGPTPYMRSVTGNSVGSATSPTTKSATLGATTEPAPTGPSAEDQLRSEVDAIFSPVFSALSGQESTLRENYSTVPTDIENQYSSSLTSIGNERTSGQGQLALQEKAVGGAKENALTSATRLYNELARGGMQRFGGASSAGEAFQTLTAQEQQRRQGTIYSEYSTAMDKIGQYKSDLEGKYQTALTQLETQKQSALDQSKRDFNDALQAIQTQTSIAESDKAITTLNTLQDYRNKIYTINAQSLSFAQQLAANNQASLSYVDQATKQLLATVNNSGVTTNTATTALSQPATSAYGVTPISSGGATTPGQYIGQISGGYRWDGNNWVPA
jgi:hypothetical protein